MKQIITKIFADVAMIAGLTVAFAGSLAAQTAEGTFEINFYDSSKLSSTSGTGLTNNNYSSFVSVPTGISATAVVTSVSVTGTVQYGKNGGLTAGTGTASSSSSHYVTFNIGSDYAVNKCTVYATYYDSPGRWFLNDNVPDSGTIGTKGATIANVTSPLIWDNLSGVTALTFKKDNGKGGNQKRLTIYKIVCEYSTSGGSSKTASDLAITNQSTALSFDLYNNSSAQVINYTTSSTGEVTINPASPTGYFSYVHDATNKTITVTPLAVTPSAQTITISQAEDDTYAAGTKAFTVSVANSAPLANIAALTESAAGSYSVTLTNALVTYVNGTNAYLEDASGAVLLYHCNDNNLGFSVGDKITGTANVTYTVYNGLPEVTAITLVDGYTKTTGNTVTPTEVTIATLEDNYTSYISRYVKIVGATVTSAFSSRNSTIQQNSYSIVLRDQNSQATLTTTVNDVVTVTAHPAIYNATHQIAVYEQSQIVVAKVDPTLTFNNGTVRVGSTLDLTTLFSSNSTGTVTYSITSGDNYATLSGSTLTGTAEGSVTVKAEQAESTSFNAGEATATITVNPALVLSSIAITTAPSKTTYDEGELFDPTGMVVTATYTDNSTDTVTGYTYSPNGALTTSDTEITVSYTENAVTKTAKQAITVNEVVDYATLPFVFNSGSSAIANTTGLSQSGLGSDYNSAPKLKFDGTGDYMILKINEEPGTLTFDIKGNNFSQSSTSTFKVQASADGVSYTNLATYTELSGTTATKTFNSLNGNVRYIKWIYVEKGANNGGNVALGNISLAKPEASIVPASLTIEATSAATEGTLNVTYNRIEEDPDILWFESDGETSASKPAWVEVDFGASNNVEYLIAANTGDARSAYFKVYGLDGSANDVYSDLVTISQEAYVEVPVVPAGDNYTLFTGDLVEGDYIIYYNGYAMKNDKITGKNRLDYEEVEPTGNVINTDVASIVWHISKSGDYWTLYNAAAGKYAASNDNKNEAQMLSDGTDDKALWTVRDAFEFVNKNNEAKEVNCNLRNNGTNGFACYSTSTGGALSLYKLNTPATAETINATLHNGLYWATFYSGVARYKLPEGTKAYTLNSSNQLYLLGTDGSVIPAGTAVVIISDKATPVISQIPNTGDIAVYGGANQLRGTSTATAVSGLSGTPYVMGVDGDGNLGFYKFVGETIPANKAYYIVND